jgi:uncharacterized protein YndB with AHSA1/START domain
MVKTDIDLTIIYPHPIDQVWAALTSPMRSPPG